QEASRKIACNDKARVAGILSKEKPCARSDHPFGTRVPGDAEPRCKVLPVGSHEPVSEAAIPRDFDRGLESQWKTFVEVAAPLADQSWMAAHIRHIRGHINERNLSVNQISRQVQEWRRVFISQT